MRKAKDQPELFAQKGWGTYKSKSKVTDYKAGDIMDLQAAATYGSSSAPVKTAVSFWFIPVRKECRFPERPHREEEKKPGTGTCKKIYEKVS